jgi:hypothetical protein
MKIPYQIRIEPEQLEDVQDYSKEETEGNANAGFRRLIRIGLEVEKQRVALVKKTERV